MIRKIYGKTKPTPLKHLTKNNTGATSKKDLVDTQAETFSIDSSLKNANRQFLVFKLNAEKYSLSFKTNNSKNFNKV